MILLVVVFILALVAVFYVAGGKKMPFSVSQPTPGVSVAPTEFISSPVLAPISPIPVLEKEFGLIEEDLRKVKEDNRLNPPSFIFSLGI